MTASQHATPAPPAAHDRQRAALRGNCMGAAVILIIEFVLGADVGLYVSLPPNSPFVSAITGSAALVAHAVVAVLLLASAVSALIRAVRARSAIVLTAAGLAAVTAAGVAGAIFATSQGPGASLAMALATAAAMFCYLAAVFALR